MLCLLPQNRARNTATPDTVRQEKRVGRGQEEGSNRDPCLSHIFHHPQVGKGASSTHSSGPHNGTGGGLFLPLALSSARSQAAAAPSSSLSWHCSHSLLTYPSHLRDSSSFSFTTLAMVSVCVPLEQPQGFSSHGWQRMLLRSLCSRVNVPLSTSSQVRLHSHLHLRGSDKDTGKRVLSK